MKSPIHPDIDMKQVTKYGITIDYCPKSGGVWLDKGELEKLIEYAKNENSQYEEDNAPFSDESNYEDNKRYHRNEKPFKRKKKRDNIFEEIFDIF